MNLMVPLTRPGNDASEGRRVFVVAPNKWLITDHGDFGNLEPYSRSDVLELVEDEILEPVDPDEDGESTLFRVRGRS